MRVLIYLAEKLKTRKFVEKEFLNDHSPGGIDMRKEKRKQSILMGIFSADLPRLDKAAISRLAVEVEEETESSSLDPLVFIFSYSAWL